MWSQAHALMMRDDERTGGGDDARVSGWIGEWVDEQFRGSKLWKTRLVEKAYVMHVGTIDVVDDDDDDDVVVDCCCCY